jgi:hypothetical protein
MTKLDMSINSQQAGLVDFILSLLAKTGFLLPIATLTVVVLAFIYNDRLVFTKPHRPGMFVPPGGLPLIGHTYNIVKLGTKKQFERFHEMALGESQSPEETTSNRVSRRLLLNSLHQLRTIILCA